MQTHGGADAEAAVISGERRFHVRLLVDWDMDGSYDHALSDLSGYAKNIKTDRSLKGGLPEEITLVEGSGAAQLQFNLSGDYQKIPMSGVFSPYQHASPFFGVDTMGAEVTYELGIETAVGIVWYPQFVGNIRTITPNRGSGYVTMTALDRVELLRRPVLFPAWAIFEYHLVRGRIVSQLANTQWVIDHCLRKANISPTPRRPTSREENGLLDSDATGPQIWINGTGGWLPTIGWCDNWNVVEFPYTEDTGEEMYDDQGAYHPDSPEPTTPPLSLRALGDTDDTILKYWCTNRDNINSLGTQVIGFTLVTRGDRGTYYQTATPHDVLKVRIGNQYQIRVRMENGQIYSEFHDLDNATNKTSSWVNIPTTEDFVHVDVIWDYFHGSGSRVYVRVGTNTNNAGNYEVVGGAETHVGNEDEIKGLFEVDHRTAMNDIYYTSTNFGGFSVASMLNWGARAAEYVAVLDKGVNGISYVPTRQANDAWEVIAEAAAAEFGVVFWDENGVFRFWNNERMLDLQASPVRELSLDDVTGLQITNSLDSVRNIYSVQAGKRIAPQGRTFEATSVDQFFNPGATETKFRIWHDTVLSPNPGKLDRFSTIPASAFPQWDDTSEQGYVVQWWNGSAWAEDDGKTSGVDIYCYFDNEGNLVVKILNGYSEDMRLVTNAGQPAMRVEGTAIREYDSQVTVTKNTASIDRFKGRNLRLEGPWYQEYYDYMGMTDQLMSRTGEPVPATDAITIAGDPRLQLGDTLRIHDREGFGERFDVQIQGISRTYDVDSGLTDTLSVEMVRGAAGIWDSFQYGIWGDTFIWGV